MNRFFKELIRGFKWVIISIIILAFFVAVWIGSAWGIGWFMYSFFNLKDFGPENFIAFGSSVLIFTLIIQIITVIITGWTLISWGRARGVIPRKSDIQDIIAKKEKK